MKSITTALATILVATLSGPVSGEPPPPPAASASAATAAPNGPAAAWKRRAIDADRGGDYRMTPHIRRYYEAARLQARPDLTDPARRRDAAQTGREKR